MMLLMVIHIKLGFFLVFFQKTLTSFLIDLPTKRAKNVEKKDFDKLRKNTIKAHTKTNH